MAEVPVYWHLEPLPTELAELRKERDRLLAELRKPRRSYSIFTLLYEDYLNWRRRKKK